MLTNTSFFSYMKTSGKRSQLGMTLIETMLVLMIGVLVIAGVVVLAQSVLTNMKINRSKQILTIVGSGVQTSLASISGDTPYTGLTNGALAKMAFVPSDLVHSDKVYLPLGDAQTTTVEVASGGSGQYFTITVEKTLQYCADLALTSFGAHNLVSGSGGGSASAGAGSVNGKAVTADPENSAFSAGAIANCVDNATIVWNHN